MPGSLRFGWHKADVTIFTNPAFVAKNQRLDSNSPVAIKSLRSFIASQQDPDNKLCPVCALLYYLKSTQSRRGNFFRLFLLYKLGQGDNKLQPIQFPDGSSQLLGKPPLQLVTVRTSEALLEFQPMK